MVTSVPEGLSRRPRVRSVLETHLGRAGLQPVARAIPSGARVPCRFLEERGAGGGVPFRTRMARARLVRVCGGGIPPPLLSGRATHPDEVPGAPNRGAPGMPVVLSVEQRGGLFEEARLGDPYSVVVVVVEVRGHGADCPGVVWRGMV